ncbi:DUF2025 family protein [Pseudomonas sp. S9]|uniref:DUF2025 family protein n=1 Tax=Pseudomonas sp. S9 TaxID=686578 RepID=UPI000255710D|nr:DUF2025 family protein [Pseudomonas sp. S9]
MSITSADICSAADQLQGLVGFNQKTDQYIVRFSEDSFGLDILHESIQPTSEFVWSPHCDNHMRLDRTRIQLLLDQHIDERLNITAPIQLYMQRNDLPEIVSERRVSSIGEQ